MDNETPLAVLTAIEEAVVKARDALRAPENPRDVMIYLESIREDCSAIEKMMWRRIRDGQGETLETLLRREWWLNHGHDGLYGDDGEMQCGRCPADFKRQPLDQLQAIVAKARLERGNEAWGALQELKRLRDAGWAIADDGDPYRPGD